MILQSYYQTYLESSIGLTHFIDGIFHLAPCVRIAATFRDPNAMFECLDRISRISHPPKEQTELVICRYIIRIEDDDLFKFFNRRSVLTYRHVFQGNRVMRERVGGLFLKEFLQLLES